MSNAHYSITEMNAALRSDGCVQCRGQRPRGWMLAGCWAALLFLLLVTSRVRAQDIFSSSTVNDSPYQDEFSRKCEQSNSANPYAGMDPLSCHGVMAPTDSRNNCSLRGITLLQKWGNTCYYCQPINPPINGIIVPLDQLAKFGRQGYRCGVDQADPKCMAICTGGGQYTPPSPPQEAPTQSACDPQAAVSPAGGGALPAQTAINMMELWAQRIDTYWFQQFLIHSFPLSWAPAFSIQYAGKVGLPSDQSHHSIQSGRSERYRRADGRLWTGDRAGS
jgi:hypothetical protein